MAVAGLVVFPSTRAPLLQWVGQLLVAEATPVGRADVVIVAVDAGAAGVLEAADLVHGGAATRVAIFATPPSRVDLELVARGVPFEEREALYRRQFAALGVASVVPTPRVSGTADQGRVLPGWCDERAFKSVIVVASWHHSRRVQRVLERAMEGYPTSVQVRVARRSEVSPDHWWQERDGIRLVVVEIQKLFFDFVSHPFS